MSIQYDDLSVIYNKVEKSCRLYEYQPVICLKHLVIILAGQAEM